MSAQEWQYLQHGRVTHARRRRGAGLDFAAICGAAPWSVGDWYGTGTQKEYERAAALPYCRRCLTIGRLCYCHPGCSACETREPCPHGQVPR